MSAQPPAQDPSPSGFQVVRGRPTPEEVAALMVALEVSSAPTRPDPVAAPTGPPATSGWAARWRGLRIEPRPGPDAWRQSGR